MKGTIINNSCVLLVGSGPMAIEYAKILTALNIHPKVVGRGKASAEKFKNETGISVFLGGIKEYLNSTNIKLPESAIVAVGEKWIGDVAQTLLNAGVRNLLLEKPGGYDAHDIRRVNQTAIKVGNAAVYIGYNRRFYASVEAAKKMIIKDGEVTSFNFDFTEWGHIVSTLEKEEGVKEQWLLSNSTHVIDLAFYLGGIPKELTAYSLGNLEWHPIASIFTGSGRTVNGAIFSYHANWSSPGRWGIEILTRKHKLILRPLEQLQVQKIGSLAIENIMLEDELDKKFKPGLYKQVQAFLAGRSDLLVSIAEQVKMLEFYLKIRGDK